MRTADDTQWRDRVRREAIAAGWPADMAAAIARHVGERPPDSVTAPPHRARAARAQPQAPRVPSSRNGRLDRLCGLYACPPSLIAEFKAAQGSLGVFADVLARANDGGKVNSPGVVERARFLFAMRAARAAA